LGVLPPRTTPNGSLFPFPQSDFRVFLHKIPQICPPTLRSMRLPVVRVVPTTSTPPPFPPPDAIPPSRRYFIFAEFLSTFYSLRLPPPNCRWLGESVPSSPWPLFLYWAESPSTTQKLRSRTLFPPGLIWRPENRSR